MSIMKILDFFLFYFAKYCDFSVKMLHILNLFFSKNVTFLKPICSVSFFADFQRKCYNILAFWPESEVKI